MSNCPLSKFTIILSSIRLLTGWLFPLNHQLLSFLKEKVLKGDAGDVILQVSFQYFTIMMATIGAMGAPSASSLGEKTKSTILGRCRLYFAPADGAGSGHGILIRMQWCQCFLLQSLPCYVFDWSFLFLLSLSHFIINIKFNAFVENISYCVCVPPVTPSEGAKDEVKARSWIIISNLLEYLFLLLEGFS